MAWLSRHPTFAGIHGRNQLKPRGVSDVIVDPRHHRLSRFHGLAKRFQHARLELWQLVEEKNPVMRQRHLARLCTQAARGGSGNLNRVDKWTFRATAA
jgi:hypothetical protein